MLLTTTHGHTKYIFLLDIHFASALVVLASAPADIPADLARVVALFPLALVLVLVLVDGQLGEELDDRRVGRAGGEGGVGQHGVALLALRHGRVQPHTRPLLAHRQVLPRPELERLGVRDGQRVRRPRQRALARQLTAEVRIARISGSEM